MNGQGQGRAPVFGSVSSINGDVLTITTQRGDTRVKISGARIQKTVEGTADDLKAGETVVVTGQQGLDGTLSANSIQIRSAGAPHRQARPGRPFPVWPGRDAHRELGRCQEVFDSPGDTPDPATGATATNRGFTPRTAAR